MLASEMIAQLQQLVAANGDKTIVLRGGRDDEDGGEDAGFRANPIEIALSDGTFIIDSDW